jgi:hypothetical protein
MKLSCETSPGTPPGGAIILGKLEGIPLLVGLADAIVVDSWMMLVPTTKVVALSVAVGRRVRTGVGVLVNNGRVGIGMVAELLSETMLGVAERVADTVADGDTDRDSDAERVADGTADNDPDADAETEPDADTDPDPDTDTDTDADADADGVTDAESVAVALANAEVEIVALLRISPEERVVV